MEDIFKSKEHEFYIDLKYEKYFFPGEDISGDVILNLTKPTKVTNVKVVLEGNVEIGGRSMSLFSKYVLIAKPSNGDKYELLEPCTHRFPFTITIPNSQECKVPSTLEIPKLLKINYQVTAILNKPYSFLEKLNASTTKAINILEDINVDSEEYKGDYKVEKEVYLTGEHRPVHVSTVIGKRAAVKGDTIPISINIKHIGVMVRDKAISVQLLRSLYYGKNKTELFGPKLLREVTSNIEISGPVDFSKEFNLQMTIPTNLCPTIEKSALSFRIEYTLKVSVNLNEQNPHRPEVPQDIVLFNLPFTLGTYPKVSFNIDDDDEEEEMPQSDIVVGDEVSTFSSEYEQVVEKMKDMDLELEINAPQMIQETKKDPSSPSTNNYGYTPLPALSTPIEPKYVSSVTEQNTKPISPPKTNIALKPDEPDEPSSPPAETQSQVPIMLNPTPSSPIKKSPAITPLERLPSNGSMISSYSTPKMEFATNVGGSGPTSPIKLTPVKQPVSSPKLPVSNYQPTTTPPPEHNVVPPTSPYNAKNNISPSNVYNNYNPTLSPSPSVHHIDNISNSVHTSVSPALSPVERQQSFHWVAPPKKATAPVVPTSPTSTHFVSKPPGTPAVVPPPIPPRPNPASPPRVNPSSSPRPNPPVSPPRPTPSISNQTAGFAFPQPMMNGTSSPSPQHFLNSNYHQQPENHYNQHQPAYVSFPQAQVPQYQNNYHPPQYNNNNAFNIQPQNNFSFPQPQPQPYMGMPSHQDYQPPPNNYPYYH